MRLETERLILRKPELADRDGYAAIWGDPEVVRFLGGLPEYKVVCSVVAEDALKAAFA